MCHCLVDSQSSYQDARIAFETFLAEVIFFTECLLLSIGKVGHTKAVVGNRESTGNLLRIAIRAEHIRTANHPSSISNNIFLEVLVKVIYTTRKMLALSEHIFLQFCERKTVHKFFNGHSGIPDLFIISI